MNAGLSKTGGAPDFLRPSDGKALLIDGRIAAATMTAGLKRDAQALIDVGTRPGLAVVLVGDDPASAVYVRSKGKLARECGFHSEQHNLSVEVGEEALLALIDRLNADPAIHGILVQVPLPKHIDTSRVLRRIDPRKDVDGFHPINAGLLATGDPLDGFVPCTPAGCMVLAHGAMKALGRTIAGSEAVVIGRSNIVGKPVAQLLLAADATVTIAHSRTRDLAQVVRRADLVVAAVGRPEFVRGAWLKPGAIVIDVGINRVETGGGKYRLAGDVAFAEALDIAGAITPVPGGVGQLTVPGLMANTLLAARRMSRHAG
jgi:methylenetetrahydrofolate dehydrogenase (NADP+)/methenyltetrahydrofolate cyclohydrolase